MSAASARELQRKLFLMGGTSGAGGGMAVGHAVPATPYSAEASQFFDRLLTPPTSARATLYAALIDALVTGGVWAKLDVLSVYAAADRSTSLTNLKSSSFYAGVILTSGTPTFTVDRGWSGGGAAGLQSVDTTFNPSTAGGNYAQNDAMIAAWVAGSTTEQHSPLIQKSQNGNIEIFPRYSAGTTYWAVNTNGTEATYASASPAGFWLAQRTASNAMALYLNNASVATSALASAALVNETLVSNCVANTAALVAIGASLTSPQLTVFYNAASAYLTAVGAT